jgi:hypothetical protein
LVTGDIRSPADYEGCERHRYVVATGNAIAIDPPPRRLFPELRK